MEFADRANPPDTPDPDTADGVVISNIVSNGEAMNAGKVHVDPTLREPLVENEPSSADRVHTQISPPSIEGKLESNDKK